MLCTSCGAFGTCPRRFIFCPVYFCYLDESGTPETTAQTSHFILLGVAIPAIKWHASDFRVEGIKRRHGLNGIEVHTGYLARKFPEQERIAGFEQMDASARRLAVQNARDQQLIRIAALRTPEKLKALKKQYAKTKDYIHLTFAQRIQLLRDLADEVGSWGYARLFADALDKTKSAPNIDVFDFAFEQVVARFHTFLVNRETMRLRTDTSTLAAITTHGLLIQDNNETRAKRLTGLMRKFHSGGTWWTHIHRIIETPLFVDSTLTSMVQIADLCAYATRRFFENGETDLFNRIFSRFEKTGRGKVVGIRHYTGAHGCACMVCQAHGRPSRIPRT